MASAYMIMGHGYEKPGRIRVPDGCTLVVGEECGMLGTISFRILEAMGTRDPAFWADPVGKKAAIEALLGRRLRIYKAGQLAPRLYVSLLSDHSEKAGIYQPSGVHRLPLDMDAITQNKEGRGDARYESTDATESFRGAVITEAGWHSQAHLFAKKPGVHYNLLCREMRASSDDITDILPMRFVMEGIQTAFPKLAAKLEGPDIYDPVRVADAWISAQESTGFTPVQHEVAAIVHKAALQLSESRRGSGSPRGDRSVDLLVQLLATPEPPIGPIMKLIHEVPTLDKGIRHYGVTPLMAAARFSLVEAMDAMIRRGASMEVRDEEGATALHYACSSRNPAGALFLISRGADVNAVDIDGDTPLLMAASKASLEPVIRTLVAAGADVNARNADDDTAAIIAAGWSGMGPVLRFLLDERIDVAHANREGVTALHQALEDGQTENATILLDTGAFDLKARTKAQVGYVGFALAAGLEDIVIRLIEAGAHINSVDLLMNKAKKKGYHKVLAYLESRKVVGGRRRTTYRHRR
jgi:ankyrin repeat protein